jgi:hypothetical protein
MSGSDQDGGKRSILAKWRAELQKHGAPRYHVRTIVAEAKARTWFVSRGIEAPDVYLRFLDEVGWGEFCGGLLCLYCPEDNGMLIGRTESLPEAVWHSYFVIGGDGTTSGDYCLRRGREDKGVYWMEWASGRVSKLSDSFVSWVEAQPKRLFKRWRYQWYLPLRDPEGVRNVVAERGKFEVVLAGYDKELVYLPDAPHKGIPRYHRVHFSILKHRASWLEWFTVKIYRAGSTCGESNYSWLSIPVSVVPIDKWIQRSVYMFDEFILPFADMKLEVPKDIDLQSPKRSAFREIEPFL